MFEDKNVTIHNLSTIGLQQLDKGLYEDRPLEGAINYEKTNYAGPFFELDLLLTARFIEQLKQADKKGKSLERHIDVGTGSNILPAIVSSPYAKEFIAIEKSRGGIERLHQLAHGSEELPQHWKGWKDVCAVMYGIGNAEQVEALSRDDSVAVVTGSGIELTGKDVFKALQNWSITPERLDELDQDRQHAGRTEAVIVPEDIKQAIWQQFVQPDNLYANVDLKNHLHNALKAESGDLFEGTDKLREYEGTGNIVSKFFVTESISTDERIFAHGELNFAKLAVDKGNNNPDENGEIFSASSVKTQNYNTFFTNAELEANPKARMEEFRAAQGVFVNIASPVVQYPDGIPQGDIVNAPMESKGGFHDDKGISVISGTANHKNPDGTDKFDTGIDLYEVAEIERTEHQLNFTKGEIDDAVRDTQQYADRFAERMGRVLRSNDDRNWDTLNERFWDKYSALNFDRPIPGDIEGLFSFIENMRQKKGGTYLDVGTGSAPEFAVAAVLAGMKNIKISDHAKGAVKWLNKELLDEYPLSDRTQMWADIAKLLSTFKDKQELLAYCKETGFDKELRNWQVLRPAEKEYWFNDRRYHLEMGKGAAPSQSFLDNDIDIKAQIREMHKEGHFAIRKFSILHPPEDLIGSADLVTANSVASCMTEKASEYCEALLNICKLARSGGGFISASYTPYDNWKQYTTDAGRLPSLPRHNYYYSVSHSLLLKEDKDRDGDSYDRPAIAKEIASVKDANAAGLATYEGDEGATSLRKPGDNRFEHLLHISGTPKEMQYKNAASMLASFQLHMLAKAESFLLEHPNKAAIVVDPALYRELGKLEEELGIKPKYMQPAETHEERRLQVAYRLDNLIDHMETNPRTVDAMDRQDETISQFVDNVYERLVGRNATNRMVTHTPAYAAQR